MTKKNGEREKLEKLSGLDMAPLRHLTNGPQVNQSITIIIIIKTPSVM